MCRSVKDLSLLLQRRYLLLTRVRQAPLNPAREFFLPAELDLRVFRGHADRAMAGDFSRLRCSTRLPPAATRYWRAGKSADRDRANRSPRPLPPASELAGRRNAQRQGAAVRQGEDPLLRVRAFRRGLEAVAFNEVF